MNASLKKIYQEYANTKFWKGRIRAPIPIIISSRTDKIKYCRFYEGYGQNTDECVQLKDAIEVLIKRGRLYEYMKKVKVKEKSHPKVSLPQKLRTLGLGENMEYSTV